MTYPDRQLGRGATLAVAAAFALFTLAACGGGSGGGGPTSMMPPGGGGQTIPTRADTLASSVTAANAAAKIARAAAAQPAPGSVTQSSNVDSRNITIDQVEITARHGSGGPSFSVRNGIAWSISTSDGDPQRISGTPSPWQGVELAKRIGDGTLYVDAYTDIEAPATRQVGGGDDGTRDVLLGTMILGSGTTISAGGGISGQRGTLDGDPGTFNCSGGCTVSNGTATRGMWTFTPDRPPGAVDVSSSDTVAWSGSFNSSRLPGTRNGQQGWFRCVSLSCGHSTSTVNGQTRRMLTGSWIFVSSTATTVTTPDADYLAGGVWLIVPDDAASAADFAFGAFADGSDPFVQSSLATVSGRATYTGAAVGVYSAKEAGATAVGYLDAEVRLTANFGDANGLGTISGSMTNFMVDDEPHAATLNLGTANIGAQNSGFFRGAVTGADSQRSYTGHWGGQFFGNGQADGRPSSVAGTFGGHSTDNVVSFVGAFGAHK